MKTVLICIPMLNNAGAQRFVTELAINLDRQRFRAIVVTTSRSLPESETEWKLFRRCCVGDTISTICLSAELSV